MPNPIEDDPELARAVGILAGRWGLVEYWVEFIFSILVGTNERKGSILFSFFKAVGTQCDIIGHLLDETPNVNDEARALIKSILKEYRDLAPERNGVIHYPFGWDTSGPTPSIYKAAKQRRGPELTFRKPTSAAAITVLADKVDALSDKIIELLAIEMWSPPALPQIPPEPSQDHTLETGTGLLGSLLPPDEER